MALAVTPPPSAAPRQCRLPRVSPGRHFSEPLQRRSGRWGRAGGRARQPRGSQTLVSVGERASPPVAFTLLPRGQSPGRSPFLVTFRSVFSHGMPPRASEGPTPVTACARFGSREWPTPARLRPPFSRGTVARRDLEAPRAVSGAEGQTAGTAGSESPPQASALGRVGRPFLRTPLSRCALHCGPESVGMSVNPGVWKLRRADIIFKYSWALILREGEAGKE